MIFKKSWFNKTLLVVLIFLIVSLILILSWFKDGHFYGGLDVGLPTYNPQKVFEMAKYIWWDNVAPGFLIPHVITSISLYFFLSFLQFLGIGSVGIQAILFFTLLFLMGFGMYLLTLSIIGHDKKIYATLAGLFYIFNPYMMAQIWHRFIHTSFFFVAFIPFLILFWRDWIKKGNYLSLLIFLLINILASYMFGTIAFVFPLWLILSLFTVSEILFPWENKSHFANILGKFTLGLVFWILVNCWWLIPVLTISQGVASQQHNIWESMATLIDISKRVILPYSLQMINSYYLFEKAELGEVYKSFFFRFIPWMGVATIFYGIVYALRKKYLVFYPLMFLIIIMLAKGSSSPFGQPFLLLFSKFFVLGLLRNPFEKIGILLPLVSSILFAVGIEGFFNWGSKKLGILASKIILVILFLLLGIYYWPMYQGTIFGIGGKPNYVEIPASYIQTDKWLNDRVQQENPQIDGRILHLPLTRSDVVTYDWEFGYHGVDSSASLFTALPSISRGLGPQRIDDSLTALSLMFHVPYSRNEDKILKFVQDFNIRFIVLHKDMEWRGIDVYNPKETEKILDYLSFLQRKIQFGDLIIYEVLPKYFKSKIILADDVNFIYPEKATFKMWPNLITSISSDNITSTYENAKQIINESHEIIIFPDHSFTYLEASAAGMENVINSLAVILYNFNSTKAFLEKSGDVEGGQIIGRVISAGEDLINSYILLKQNNNIQAILLIEKYTHTISKLFEQDPRKSKLSFFIDQSTLDNIFKLHLLILEDIETVLNFNQKEIISPAKDKIKQYLNNYKLLPNYPMIKSDNLVTQERQVNQFSIPAIGKYELLMVDSSISDIYPNKLEALDFQINNQLYNPKATKETNLISYGEREFNKGEYEISFNNLLSNNLIVSNQLTKTDNVSLIDQDTYQLTSNGQDVAYIEGDLGVTTGEDTYQVTIDGSFLAGFEFYVQIIQDGDEIVNGIQKPRVGTFIYRTRQDSNFQNYSFKLSPLNLATRKAKFRIIIDPIGTESFNTPLSPYVPTTVAIRNLRVFRVLNNQIFLRSKTERGNQSLASGQIYEMKQKNPVLYEGKLKIDRPTFLIFKETFYPGWELELRKGDNLIKVEKHNLANLYSNSWWIENTGEYSFKIEYKPQQGVILGTYLALAGFLGVIVLFLKSKINKKNES